jgi:hypothetical protein
VFTFGRDHEKKCAAAYVRNLQQLPLIETLIDKIHDFLEGKATFEDVCPNLRMAFTKGGSGIWEQAGGWLNKLCREFPEFYGLWEEFSMNTSAIIRLRVASHLDEMPKGIAGKVYQRLSIDRSEKVKRIAMQRFENRHAMIDAQNFKK